MKYALLLARAIRQGLAWTALHHMWGCLQASGSLLWVLAVNTVSYCLLTTRLALEKGINPFVAPLYSLKALPEHCIQAGSFWSSFRPCKLTFPCTLVVVSIFAWPSLPLPAVLSGISFCLHVVSFRYPSVLWWWGPRCPGSAAQFLLSKLWETESSVKNAIQMPQNVLPKDKILSHAKHESEVDVLPLYSIDEFLALGTVRPIGCCFSGE